MIPPQPLLSHDYDMMAWAAAMTGGHPVAGDSLRVHRHLGTLTPCDIETSPSGSPTLGSSAAARTRTVSRGRSRSLSASRSAWTRNGRRSPSVARGNGWQRAPALRLQQLVGAQFARPQDAVADEHVRAPGMDFAKEALKRASLTPSSVRTCHARTSDFPRAGLRVLVLALKEAGVAGNTGAEHGKRSSARLT